jgi:hypothetical protein
MRAKSARAGKTVAGARRRGNHRSEKIAAVHKLRSYSPKNENTDSIATGRPGGYEVLDESGPLHVIRRPTPWSLRETTPRLDETETASMKANAGLSRRVVEIE